MAREELLDERFTALLKDPKYKKPRREEKKIKIDKRFKSMFKNKSFKVKYTVDKRGRPVTASSSEDYKKFYDLTSEENSSDESSYSSESETSSTKDVSQFPKLLDEENVRITRDIRDKLADMNVDYARGEGRLFLNSSSDESESEESENEELYHEWNELDKDAEVTDQSTNRLAICNMDWDRIRAVDLMMILNSFLPNEAEIHSVVIYPSEYGLKRMQEEECYGPQELVNTNTKSTSDSENDENETVHMERMRKYQLNRLKYYYAIATFDSPKTADHIYNNCNGVEFESSGIRLDLRFVDEDTTFDQEPKDECKNLDSYENYQPRFFTNTALQQAKVELTWDETDPKRLEFTRKINEALKSGDINDSDLENYVALSSSDEEEEEKEDDGDDENTEDERVYEAVISASESEGNEDDDPIATYRKLLKEIEENEECDHKDEEELEILWGPDSKKIVIPKTTELSKNKTYDQLTPFERLIEKKKEKSKLKKVKTKTGKEEQSLNDEPANKKDEMKNKKLKKKTPEIDEKQKQELELLILNENDDNKYHFSLNKIKENEKKKSKTKRYRKKDKRANEIDEFQVDVNDERFSAIYTSHVFNIDPTNPKYHKTKGMEAFVNEKQRRIVQLDENCTNEPPLKLKKTSTNSKELTTLVDSVRNKTKNMLLNKFLKN